jgi:hypothetical protein
MSNASVRQWTLSKLERLKDKPRIIVRDPLRLLAEADGAIDEFARDNQFTVIVASTNLVFRELYVRAVDDPEMRKLMLIDRAEPRRSRNTIGFQAPPPLYPDLLAQTDEEACITLDLRQYLRDETGDPDWPQEVNEPRYARLVVQHLDAVIRAHRNLRTADSRRFTDQDFKQIVAFAALGIPDAAFKKLDIEDYWKIGLFGLQAIEELERLVPEVTGPLKQQLRSAPEPFRWFVDRDPETVLRAFYLALILAQHVERWSPLLANISPELRLKTNLSREELFAAAQRLVQLDPEQAHRDLALVEESLDQDALSFLLIEQLNIAEPARFADVIERERYSPLVRSAALVMALEHLLSGQHNAPEHARIAAVLFPDDGAAEARFVDQSAPRQWSQLKEAYRLAGDLQSLLARLVAALRQIAVRRPAELTAAMFRELWNTQRVNRLEYQLSALERLIDSNDFLPRPEHELPAEITGAVGRVRTLIRDLNDSIAQQLDELNRHFQAFVAANYANWISSDSEVILTSQFLRRCLKPHWDPARERAVLFIFDGMRYDIWDELLRPLLIERMELIADLPGSSLLPSETHITRKAISAGLPPDQFDSSAAESDLLRGALAREFGYTGSVEVLQPEGSGTGETVRYRAGQLEVYIFELCDKELHKIQMKTLPDGRTVPGRPLAFLYQQLLKNIIHNEVMAIMRGLAPETKVFITADHGFGRVARDSIWIDAAWLNEPGDCKYLTARLRESLASAGAPRRVREHVWEFPVSALQMPASETRFDRRSRSSVTKHYASIIFPKTGVALSRPNSRFDPDAFTHGGISIQELTIPMVVLKVRPRSEGILAFGSFDGPTEVLEGEEGVFRLPLRRSAQSGADDLRVDLEAQISVGAQADLEAAESAIALPAQVLFVPPGGAEAIVRVKPDAERASPEERRAGELRRLLTVTVSYRDGRRTVRQAAAREFVIRLNSEKIMRRVGNLGNILGLTPKGMR